MAPLFLILALVIQGSFINAFEDENVSREILETAPEHAPPKEFRAIETDWLDLFMLPQGSLHPSSAAAKMAQVTNSDKSDEEKLEEMKEIANHITMAIQSEMANLLSYALKDCDKDLDKNSLRKRRSAESPMDSTQLVTRLLRHIKATNEHQNIVIENMLSAQEIADKFGIEYSPDSDMLATFAESTTKQAADLVSILKDASEMMNSTKEVEFIPIADEPAVKSTENDTGYFTYTVHPEDIAAQYDAQPDYEYVPDTVQHNSEPVHKAHIHYEYHAHPNHAHANYPTHQHYETQIPPPHEYHRSSPVSQMPHYFEPYAFTPAPEYYQDYYPVYYPEPMTTTTTIVLPIEDMMEPEPELVGEEFEETVSSKVFVDRGDEPGSATVNHVMTYTLSEKSHFKKPQYDSLPQQMQYYFFLM